MAAQGVQTGRFGDPRQGDAYSTHLGIRWDAPEVARLTIRPDLVGIGGLLLGAVSFALIDYCMGSTLYAHTTDEEEFATTSFALNYIAGAADGEVVCTTELDRRIRHTAALRAQVHDADGRLLVSAIATFAIFAARRRTPDAQEAAPHG